MGNVPVKTSANGESKPLEPQRILIAVGEKEFQGEDLKINQAILKNFNPNEISAWFFRLGKGHQPGISIRPRASNTHQVAQDHVQVCKKIKAILPQQPKPARCHRPACGFAPYKSRLADNGGLPDLTS